MKPTLKALAHNSYILRASLRRARNRSRKRTASDPRHTLVRSDMALAIRYPTLDDGQTAITSDVRS